MREPMDARANGRASQSTRERSTLAVHPHVHLVVGVSSALAQLSDVASHYQVWRLIQTAT
jgi:hypothetical protein